MSIVNGVRAAAEAYYNETGRHLDMIVVDRVDYSTLATEVGGGAFDGIEVDDIIVTTISRIACDE